MRRCLGCRATLDYLDVLGIRPRSCRAQSRVGMYFVPFQKDCRLDDTFAAPNQGRAGGLAPCRAREHGRERTIDLVYCLPGCMVEPAAVAQRTQLALNVPIE